MVLTIYIYSVRFCSLSPRVIEKKYGTYRMVVDFLLVDTDWILDCLILLVGER